MDYVINTISNLIHQTAFFNLTWGNYLMIVVALVFLYLAVAKGYEPLLLVPISFGMLLVNMFPDIMISPEEASNGVGGLLHYFYLLDEWSILPSLIFMGVGAMTDFGPLIANPKSFLLGAAAQFGIYSAYFMAILMGFNDKAAAAISIIGGADGPTSIFLCGKLGQTEYMGPIAVAAYSYMSLVPIIQPPIMKLLTTEKERKIKMEQLRPVSKLERILFPIIVTIVVVTTAILNKGGNKQTAIPVSEEYTTKREVYYWYTSLDQIRTSTSDPVPASVSVTIALGYKKDDKMASSEITERRIEIIDFLRRFFSEQTVEDLKPQNEELLRQQIRDQINDDILSNSRIRDVRFTGKDVVQQ